MGHDHDHHSSSSNLKIAFFLNLAFTVIELFGGIWTNSIAILTDVIHDFGDSVSLGLAWYFDHYSQREKTARHTYGYRRFRLLGGLVTGLILLIGLGFVLYHAVIRLNEPAEVRVSGMFVLAFLGIAFNGAAVLRMNSGTSLTEKLVSWHLLEDLLGWVAVLIGAAVIAVWNLPIVDPILSIGISMIVLWNVGRNLKKVILVLLQATPEEFDVDRFEEEALKIPGVDSFHHIHCWSIDGESHVFSAHLVLSDESGDQVEVKRRVHELIDDETFEHITLEIEMPWESCSPREAHDHEHES